jgi:hypothetical protein
MENALPVDLIKSLWGAKLHRFRRDAVANVPLPESSRNFLVEVGLPTATKLTVGLGFKFSPEDLLAPFAELLDVSESECSHQNDWKRLRRYRSFGMSFEAYLCVDEKDGAVYRVDTVNASSGIRAEDRFVNTSIEQFTSCMAWLEECMQLAKDHSMEYRDSLRKLRQEFAGIDPAAISDSAFWPAFLDELG